jgi:hypothetical protein
MGRFDDLMNLDTTPSSPPPEVSNPPTKEKQDGQAKSPTSQSSQLLANQQGSKETNQQSSKPERIQLGSADPIPAGTAPHQETTKAKKKYGTYLRADSIKQIQLCAIQTDRKDHEVLQEAIDLYFSGHKK